VDADDRQPHIPKGDADRLCEQELIVDDQDAGRSSPDCSSGSVRKAVTVRTERLIGTSAAFRPVAGPRSGIVRSGVTQCRSPAHERNALRT
jgi:hypothetical protein